MKARQALPGDEAALLAFLARHADTSMFLRGNLARHGLGPSNHPHATTYWIWPADGAILAVLGLTQAGVMLCQAPGAPAPVLRALLQAAAGQTVSGMTGEAGQSAVLIAACDLAKADIRVNATEPLYRLDLSDLAPATDALRPPQPADVDLLTRWFTAYFRDTGFAPPDPLAEAQNVRSRVAAAIAGDTHCRLLADKDGRPVAMAALNACVGEMVQVGGVYVPPAARNRGLGRRVTAALLAQARDGGATKAVLFANNPAAARAYEAIGFHRIGEYRIVFLSRPVVLGAGA